MVTVYANGSELQQYPGYALAWVASDTQSRGPTCESCSAGSNHGGICSLYLGPGHSDDLAVDNSGYLLTQ